MPDRIAEALLELAASNRKLATELGHFTTEIRSIDRRRRRQLGGLLVGIVLLLAATGANLVTLQIVRCALTPGCSIYERNGRNTAKLVGDLVVEGDCRERRARVGLPAPADWAKPCIAQTPLEIYPGPGPG